MSNPFCECNEDGPCRRYGRNMGGRMRDICAGVDVDLGTAAAFREQWLREAGPAAQRGNESQAPTPLLLKTDQAAGDAVAMTAAIYSLHRAHPGKYLTAVTSKYPEVFQYSPDLAYAPGALPLHMHYPAIHESNDRAIHFMQGWCEFLGAALGVQVPLLTNRPCLYFADPAPPVEDFWLVCSGGKRDFTCKLWGRHNYQEVVDRLREQGNVWFVQVGGDGPDEDHPRLSGVQDMVGKTSLRQLFDLTRRTRGVLCGVSLLMHVAAALEKPAVVVAGGREPVPWNAYPRQHYVHTVGALPCRSTQGHVGGGCWRSRVVPLGDGTVLDEEPCQRPVDGTPTKLTRCIIPECMAMIRPAEVVELVLRYDKQYDVPELQKV